MRYARKSVSPSVRDEVVMHVAQHISSCCSATDDGDEFAGQVDIVFEGIENEPEAVMVVGTLVGHEPRAKYFDTPYVSNPSNKAAKIAPPVDLTPAQLQEHLLRKAQL
jgi:hypothetical protein